MFLVPDADLIVENKIGHGRLPLEIQEEFCKIGEGIVGRMIAQGFIEPHFRVLDVGCGLGRLARALVSHLKSGEYYGLDVSRSSVDWCQNAYRGYRNFHWVYADVFSTTYNKNARIDAFQYEFPFPDDHFDFVLSTSLFTHMLIRGVERYLGEMSRVLKCGSACWNTYLLLDDVAAALVEEAQMGSTAYHPFEVEGGRVASSRDPAARSVLFEERVLAAHDRHHLAIDWPIRYGSWSGRSENVTAGWQDIVIARKASSVAG